MSSSNATTAKTTPPAPTAIAAAEEGWDEHSVKILEVKKLMKQRDELRKNADFSKADSLRDKLIDTYGVIIVEQNDGPSGWRFRDGSTKKLRKIGAEIPVPQPNTAAKRKAEVDATMDAVLCNTKSNVSSSKKTKYGDKSKAPNEQARLNNVLDAFVGSTESVNKIVQGVIIEDLKIGSGRKTKSGDKISMQYTGKLHKNGKVFDASHRPFVFKLGRGEVIRGWEIGCLDMCVGGKRKLTIPPEKGYGKSGSPPVIPPNATLVFEVTLLNIA